MILLDRGDRSLESVVDASTSRCSARRRSTCSRSAPTAFTSTTASTNTTSSPTGRGRSTSRSTRSPASPATASATDSEQEFRPFYSAYSTDAAHSSRPTSRAARAAAAVPSSRSGAAAVGLHRQRGVPLAGRSGGGAVQRRPAPAVDPGALHEPRPAAADADGHRHRPISTLDVAAPVTSIRSVGGPSRPVRAAGRRRDGMAAISHLSLNYLSLVQSTPKEGAAALRELLELYARHRRQRAAADRGLRSVRVAPVVRRLPRRRAAGVRPRAGDDRAGRRAGIRRRERVPARVGARPVFRALRLDQLVHRNRAAIARAAARSTDGCRNGARDRRSERSSPSWRRRRTASTSIRRCAGWSACPRPAALGRALAGRRAGAARPGCRAGLRAVDLRFVRGGKRRAAAPPGTFLRPVRPQRTAAAAPHGVRPRADTQRAANRRWPASRASSTTACSSCSTAPGPRLSRTCTPSGPEDDRFARYVGAILGPRDADIRDPTRCPTSRSSLLGALIAARSATARGWSRMVQMVASSGCRWQDGGVPRAVAAAG